MSSDLPVIPVPPLLLQSVMAHSDRRVAPEFVTSYTVSEAQSPAPSPWRKPRLERPEENLTVEEIYVAPPLPRRPDYEYGHRFNDRRSRPWAPPPTPVDYREDYYKHPITGYRDNYNHVLSQERYRQQWRARSPQISESSSACSATDCEECAFAESRRRFDGGARGRTDPVPYTIVPGNSVKSRTMPPLRMCSMNPSVHTCRTSQPHHLHDSPWHCGTLESPLPTREASLTDNTALVPSSHNQMMAFHGTTWDSGSGGQAESDEVSIMHPSVSSPRWSEIGQRYVSGSESRSGSRSRSPPTSLGGLYEQPDPRFIQVRPPARGHMQRPVVIARSNDRYEPGRFEEGPYNDYSDEYSESGSDRRYAESESERSCSSGDSNEHYSRDYERRYW